MGSKGISDAAEVLKGDVLIVAQHFIGRVSNQRQFVFVWSFYALHQCCKCVPAAMWSIAVPFGPFRPFYWVFYAAGIKDIVKHGPILFNGHFLAVGSAEHRARNFILGKTVNNMLDLGRYSNDSVFAGIRSLHRR